MKKITPKIIILIVIAIIAAIVSVKSMYIVEKDEQAVITQFGRYVRTEEPGLHMLVPFIEEHINVPVKKILKQEFGYKSKANNPNADFYRGKKELQEARMLSADMKIIQIEWIVQYKITDPKKYIFNVNNPTKTFRDLATIAMSQIAGDYLFDEIITIAKSDIVFKMQQLLEQMIADVDMGVGITTIQLMNVTPPQEVEAAYNEVLQAQQEKDKIVNEAKMEYNKKVIPVEGEAQRLIAQAEGYEAQRVKVAEGEAKYFEALYSEYIKAPDVTKKRMYLETISEILPKLEDITIVDENQRNLLPFLPLNSQNGKAQGGK